MKRTDLLTFAVKKNSGQQVKAIGESMHWRAYLRIQTQNPPFLWRMVIGVLLAGVMISYAVSGLGILAGERNGAHRMLQVMVQGGELDTAWTNLIKDKEHFERLLGAIAEIQRASALSKQLAEESPAQVGDTNGTLEVDPLRDRLAELLTDPDRKAIALALWKSCGDGRPSLELTVMAEFPKSPRFANHALGEFWKSMSQWKRAAEYFEREGRTAEAQVSRKSAVNMYLASREYDSLERLAKQELYQDAIDVNTRLNVKVAERDWLSVWWLIPLKELHRFRLGPTMLALFVGLWWFLFALHAGQAGSSRGTRIWLCAVAVPLGFLSIWLTDFFIYWQRESWGLVEQSDLAGGVKYYVVGVGLREELSKALMTLPLIPFLARRGRTLETLTVCACVGLGFAIVENQAYYAMTFGSSAIGRFITASFFHMASTGVIGLAIMRAVRDVANRGPEAAAWFVIIVLAHGFYDAFIAVPALVEYSIVGQIILVLLAYQFFRELRDSRLNRAETVSLTATFLFSVSIVTAATLIYVSDSLTFSAAIMMLAPNILGAAVMVYVFLREMPNSLVSV